MLPVSLREPEDGAQPQVRCPLDHDAPNHSGEYYSQIGFLYVKEEDRGGGWPMRSPNQLVYDDKLAEQLNGTSLKLVGVEGK